MKNQWIAGMLLAAGGLCATSGNAASVGVVGVLALGSPSFRQDGNDVEVDGETSYGGGIRLAFGL